MVAVQVQAMTPQKHRLAIEPPRIYRTHNLSSMTSSLPSQMASNDYGTLEHAAEEEEDGLLGAQCQAPLTEVARWLFSQ